MSDALEELLGLSAQLEKVQNTTRLSRYRPYPYQIKFHHAKGYKQDKLAQDRALVAANKVGKTLSAAMEIAMHATGLYPDWWQGHSYTRALGIMCASNTYDNTKAIQQAELFGAPEDDDALGTGAIPLANIGKITKKPGVQNAFESVLVKHVSGRWSVINFKAYEQGFKKFMGKANDVSWCDEEPPQDIKSQVTRSTFAKHDAIILLTFTPEEGMTSVVSQYFNDLQPGQALITATWDDAAHMTAEVRAEKLAAIPAHEREMRSKGVPLSAAGLVFAVSDETLLVQPFEIPKHWPRVNGIDFGWDHPFAAASLAWDRDNDCVYLVSEYRESRALPAVHTQAIQAWGAWIPTAWPHDGLNTEKGSGDELIKQYRDVGLNTFPHRTTNPPQPGEAEGTGGNSVEASIMDMLVRMETGRFKVFATCSIFMEEKRMYHRKDGKIVKLADDLISAVRYAVMMLRHAQVERPKTTGFTGRTRDGIAYMTARPTRR